MATLLNYTAYPIATRVDPRGRYYAKVESTALTAEETIRGIMAYKKITAYSEGTVLQLLNDLLQGAVELTALDGKTRTIGQMLRVYMSLEGSFSNPILSTADKNNLKVRTQLLKDMKYPVNPSNFTLTPKDKGLATITAVHYSGQDGNEDAVKQGKAIIINGRNFENLPWSSLATEEPLIEINVRNNANGRAVPLVVNTESGYQPSYGAILTNAMETSSTVFPGSGPWDAEVIFLNPEDTTMIYAKRDVKVYAADAVTP